MSDTVTVALPTKSTPSYVQMVIGRKSSLSQDIDEFRGIPYGTVPARWEHSILRKWLPRDVFDASSNGPRCPQPAWGNSSESYQSHLDFPADVAESEFDCLNLSITRPSRTTLDRLGHASADGLPVLVWIHGGGFAFGAGTDPMWDPVRLVLRSVSCKMPLMVVRINYRLHAFGFMGSSDIIHAQHESNFRGLNFGLCDQKVAMAWISQNIVSFGGDNEQITLGGQSAGACSVSYHILDAKLKMQTNFQRAIIQSGAIGTLGPTSLDEADAEWQLLCGALGFRKDDKAAWVSMVKNVPASVLVKTCDALNWGTFSPIVDNLTVKDATTPCGLAVDLNSTRLDKPAHLGTPIDILIGDTEAEGASFSQAISTLEDFDRLKSLLEATYAASAESILKGYGLTRESAKRVFRQGLVRLITDLLFGFPVYWVRKLFETYQAEDVLPTTVQPFRVEVGNPFPGPQHGVSHHCVELIYLFDAFHDALSEVDQSVRSPHHLSHEHVVQTMQSHWIAFVAGQRDSTTGQTITVYGHDGMVSNQSLLASPKWLAQEEKYKLLAQSLSARRLAAKELLRISFASPIHQRRE